MCTYICMYVDIYIYIYIYVCIHIYIYVHILVYMCVCVYMYIYIYIRLLTHTHTQTPMRTYTGVTLLLPGPTAVYIDSFESRQDVINVLVPPSLSISLLSPSLPPNLTSFSPASLFEHILLHIPIIFSHVT